VAHLCKVHALIAHLQAETVVRVCQEDEVKNYQNFLQRPKQETKSVFTYMTQKPINSPLSGKPDHSISKESDASQLRTNSIFFSDCALFIRNLSLHAKWLTSTVTERFYKRREQVHENNQNDGRTRTV